MRSAGGTQGGLRGGLRALLAALTVAGALAPTGAVAGPEDVDLDLVHPSFAPNALVGSSGARTGDRWAIRAGLALQYERHPLVAIEDRTILLPVVSDRVSLWAGGFVSLGRRLGVGLSMPLYLQWGEHENVGPGQFTTGDLRVEVLGNFVDNELIALGARARVWVPTSTPGTFSGERVPRIAPAVVFELGTRRLALVTELELVVRQTVSTGHDLELGPQLAGVIGGRVSLLRDALLFHVELAGRTTLPAQAGGSPIDLRAGLRVSPAKYVAVDVHGGIGLTGGLGASVGRAGLTVTFVNHPYGERADDWSPWARRVEDIVDPEDDGVEDPEPVEVAQIEVAEEISASGGGDEDDADLAGGWEEPPPEPAALEPDAPPLAELREDEDRIHIRESIRFAFGSDTILAESLPVLDSVRAILAARPDIGLLVIEGHASPDGTPIANWQLSNRRAAAVYRYLVEAGVNPYRLAWRPMGESAPLEGVTDPDQQRRVELRIERWLELSEGTAIDWEANKPPVPWRPVQPEATDTDAEATDTDADAEETP